MIENKQGAAIASIKAPTTRGEYRRKRALVLGKIWLTNSMALRENPDYLSDH
jgi:hypothetical protein